MVRGPGTGESYAFLRQIAFATTCSLAHSSAARSRGILSECKISHIAISEHVGFYVVIVMLDLKSGFLIWKLFANWCERSEPHTCGENGKLSIYIYIYIYGTCVFRIYILPYLCAMQYFHTAPLLLKRQD